MYIDKMIEYLVLANITNEFNSTFDIDRFRRDYDLGKVYDRMDELKREFLEPYAINKKSSD